MRMSQRDNLTISAAHDPSLGHQLLGVHSPYLQYRPYALLWTLFYDAHCSVVWAQNKNDLL